MKTLLARQRPDLQEFNIPASDGRFYWLYDNWYNAEQPDALDHDEYNVIVEFGSTKLRFKSIDLEFKDKETK